MKKVEESFKMMVLCRNKMCIYNNNNIKEY